MSVLATYTYILTNDGTAYSVICNNGSECTEAIIPNTYNSLPVISIGFDAFTSCTSLTRVVIPDSVTSIGDYAFSGCISLISIIIPDSVTSIGSSAFSNCESLTSVVIGDSVTYIGFDAFYYCSSLKSITLIPKTPPTLGSGAFSSISSVAKFYCYSSAVNMYKSASSWNSYSSMFVGDDIRISFTSNAIQINKKFVKKEYLNEVVGDIETALDNIITIQNSLIGGNS